MLALSKEVLSKQLFFIFFLFFFKTKIEIVNLDQLSLLLNNKNLINK